MSGDPFVDTSTSGSRPQLHKSIHQSDKLMRELGARKVENRAGRNTHQTGPWRAGLNLLGLALLGIGVMSPATATTRRRVLEALGGTRERRRQGGAEGG